MTLGSETLTYRVQGSQPKVAQAVSGYQQFADWYARLNSLRPGSLPPFARLELNKAVAEQGWIPEEVELTVAPAQRLLGRALVLRSRHLANWRLSNTDRKRIETAGKQLAEFQSVSFSEYRRSLELAKK